MTVCINGTCPFEDCSHHPGRLKGMPRGDTVTVMSLDAVCRRYIGWLADKENFPVADVAPVVHGRWISWEEAGNTVPSPDRHECSVCHDAAQVLVNGLELLSDYCPNCGAKMDGESSGK